jgi:hypothetical protein
MGGALLQLVSCESSENVWINSQPQITFFKAVFRRHTEFAKENISVGFNGTFGSRVSVEIPSYGDLAYQIVLAVDIPEMNAIYPNTKIQDLLIACQQLQLPEKFRQIFIDSIKAYDIETFLNIVESSIQQTQQMLENAITTLDNLDRFEISAQDIYDLNSNFKFDVYDLALGNNSIYNLIKLMYTKNKSTLQTRLIPDNVPLDSIVKNELKGYLPDTITAEIYDAALGFLLTLKSSQPIIFAGNSITRESKQAFINTLMQAENLAEQWEKPNPSNPLIQKYMQAIQHLFENLNATWGESVRQMTPNFNKQFMSSNLYSYIHKTPILNTMLLHFMANLDKMPNINNLHQIVKKNIEYLMDELSYLMNSLYSTPIDTLSSVASQQATPSIIYYRGILPHIFDIFEWIDNIINQIDDPYVANLINSQIDIEQEKVQISAYYKNLLQKFLSRNVVDIPNGNFLQIFFDIESAYVFEMSQFLENTFGELPHDLINFSHDDFYVLSPTLRFHGQSYISTSYYSRLHQSIVPAPHPLPDAAFAAKLQFYNVPDQYIKHQIIKASANAKSDSVNYVVNTNYQNLQQKVSQLINLKHRILNENQLIFPKYIDKNLFSSKRSLATIVDQIDKLNGFIANPNLNPIDHLILLRDRYLLQRAFSENLETYSMDTFKNSTAGFMLLNLLAKPGLPHIAPLVFLYPEFNLEETAKLSQIYVKLDSFEKKLFRMFTSIFDPGSEPKFTKTDILNLVTYTHGAINDLVKNGVQDTDTSWRFVNLEYQDFARDLKNLNFDAYFNFDLENIYPETIGELLEILIEQLWINQVGGSSHLSDIDTTDVLQILKASLQESTSKINTNLQNLLELRSTVATILTRSPKPKTAWVHRLAHFLIDEITIENISSTLTSASLESNYQLNIGVDQRQAYHEMIGEIPELTTFNAETKPKTRIYLPLIFYFNTQPGAAIPLVSLQNTSIRLNIKFRDIEQITYVDEFAKFVENMQLQNTTLDIEYIYLGKTERQRFLTETLEYVITDTQTYTTSTSQRENILNLNSFTNPTKFMTFTAQPELHINPLLRNNVIDYWRYFPGERQYTNYNMHPTYDLHLIQKAIMDAYDDLRRELSNSTPIDRSTFYLIADLNAIGIDYEMFDEDIYGALISRLSAGVGIQIDLPMKSFSRSTLHEILPNFTTEVDLAVNAYNHLINTYLANSIVSVMGFRKYSFAKTIDYFYNVFLLKDLDGDALVSSELTVIRALVQIHGSIYNSKTNIRKQTTFAKNTNLHHYQFENFQPNLMFARQNGILNSIQIDSRSYDMIYNSVNINIKSQFELIVDMVNTFDPKIDFVGLLRPNIIEPTVRKAQLFMNSRPISEYEGPVYWNAVTTYRKFLSIPEMGHYVYAWLLNNQIFNPSGSVNLSKIDKFELELDLLEKISGESIIIKVQTQSYGLIRCALGLCGRVY